MPLKTFYEWLAYSQIRPFANSERRADMRAGILAAVSYNVPVSLWTKKPKLKKPEDFIPTIAPPKPKKTGKEIYDLFKIALSSGGRLIDKRGPNDGR